MDPTMPKNDRGACMLRKRSRQEDFAGVSSKSLGSDHSVSRSREPSQHSRGDSSVRADTSVYIAGSVSRFRNPAVKSSAISVERQ